MKWNKVMLITCIIGGILLLKIMLSVTNIFRYYKIPVIVNEPTIRKGSYVFCSRFATPKVLDFICFRGITPNGNETLLFRLCGLPGDIVEIKNGMLFINGVNVDDKLELKNEYVISEREFYKSAALQNEEDLYILRTTSDSLIIFLSKTFIKNENIDARQVIFPTSYLDSAIYQVFKRNWNQDQFGPITIPADKFFVLGDNRHNALDSRYLGLIDKKDYLSTVVIP